MPFVFIQSNVVHTNMKIFNKCNKFLLGLVNKNQKVGITWNTDVLLLDENLLL